MAGSMTNFLELELLDHVFGKGAYSAPTPYLALFTAAPTDAGGGTEVSGGSYARVSISSAMDAAASGAITNGSTITFPGFLKAYVVVSTTDAEHEETIRGFLADAVTIHKGSEGDDAAALRADPTD